VIQFPETAATEWQVVADASNVEHELRKQIHRGTEVERELERMLTRHEATTLFQQEIDGSQTPTLEMFDLIDYQNNPNFTAPVDLIDGVMKDNGLIIVLGESGSGKSTLAMQMIHSMNTGTDWLGQTTKPLTGAYGIMSYDMDASMLAAMLVEYPNMDMGKVKLVNAYKRGNPLGVPQFRRQIVEAWKAANVEVVVIDSFSASFFGMDQNDAAATMHYYRDMKLFALSEVGARALVVIVHSTENNPLKARGSTVQHDVADSIVAVEGKGPVPRKVRMVKYRAAPGQHEMTPVIVTAPDSVTHLVSLDPGEMSLAGMHLPPSMTAQAFPDLPDAIEEPDTESEDGEDDDL